MAIDCAGWWFIPQLLLTLRTVPPRPHVRQLQITPREPTTDFILRWRVEMHEIADVAGQIPSVGCASVINPFGRSTRISLIALRCSTSPLSSVIALTKKGRSSISRSIRRSSIN